MKLRTYGLSVLLLAGLVAVGCSDETTSDGGGSGGTGNTGNTGGNEGGSGNTGGNVSTTCGNGTIEDGELCDGANFGSQTCDDFGGYAQGFLSCSADCGAIDSSLCFAANTTCGDDEPEGMFETCDGSTDYMCEDLGYSGGTLVCDDNCQLDLSGCTGDFCEAQGWYGDGACDPCDLWGGTPDEDCDGCGADGTCASYLNVGLSPVGSTCLIVTGTEDPDCGTCGDGTRDYIEWCDTDDFGENPRGCFDLGYVGGTVACDENCHLDAAGCLETLPCTATAIGTFSGTTITQNGDTCDSAASDLYEGGACTGWGSPGSELTYTLIVAANNTVRITVTYTGEHDASLYLLSDCGDPTSCVAGADNEETSAEHIVLPATTTEETYTVVVDGYTDACAAFTLTVETQPPETACLDFEDNDENGLFDCQDANCQSLADCQGGTGAHGTACDAHNDCVATDNDPFCFTEADTDYAGGYCSEFCDLDADDCGADAICVGSGICAQTCDDDDDCRTPDYHCVDYGLADTICDWTCTADCPWDYVGDEYCDDACNIAACNNDGGDCD